MIQKPCINSHFNLVLSCSHVSEWHLPVGFCWREVNIFQLETGTKTWHIGQWQQIQEQRHSGLQLTTLQWKMAVFNLSLDLIWRRAWDTMVLFMETETNPTLLQPRWLLLICQNLLNSIGVMPQCTMSEFYMDQGGISAQIAGEEHGSWLIDPKPQLMRSAAWASPILITIIWQSWILLERKHKSHHKISPSIFQGSRPVTTAAWM